MRHPLNVLLVTRGISHPEFWVAFLGSATRVTWAPASFGPGSGSASGVSARRYMGRPTPPVGETTMGPEGGMDDKSPQMGMAA